MASNIQINIRIFTHSTQEFLDIFYEKLQVLLHHSLTAIQQPTFQNYLKLGLNTNAYNVVCDFTENYSFILWDEFSHFTVKIPIPQFTLVIYFKNADNTLGHINYVVMSDGHQNAIAVYFYYWHLVQFIIKFQTKPKWTISITSPMDLMLSI